MLKKIERWKYWWAENNAEEGGKKEGKVWKIASEINKRTENVADSKA